MDRPMAYDVAAVLAEVADLHTNPVDVPPEEQDESDVVMSTDPEGGQEEAVFEVGTRSGHRYLVTVKEIR